MVKSNFKFQFTASLERVFELRNPRESCAEQIHAFFDEILFSNGLLCPSKSGGAAIFNSSVLALIQLPLTRVKSVGQL